MSSEVNLSNAPFKSLTWKSVLFNLIGFPLTIFYFALMVAGISISVGLLIVVVGFFIGYGVLWLIHGMAPVEAWLVTRLLDTPIRASLPDPQGSFLERYAKMFSSPSTWGRIGYIPVKMVLVSFGFGFAVGGVSSLSFVAAPFLYQQSWFDTSIGSWSVDNLGAAIVVAVAGLVVAWVLLYLSMLVGRLTAMLARTMISDPLYGSGPAPLP